MPCILCLASIHIKGGVQLMYAIIESCGKQYKVAEGDVVHMGRGADPVYDRVGHDSRRNPSPHAGALRVPHLPHQAGEPWLGSGHSGRTE